MPGNRRIEAALTNQAKRRMAAVTITSKSTGGDHMPKNAVVSTEAASSRNDSSQVMPLNRTQETFTRDLSDTAD